MSCVLEFLDLYCHCLSLFYIIRNEIFWGFEDTTLGSGRLWWGVFSDIKYTKQFTEKVHDRRTQSLLADRYSYLWRGRSTVTGGTRAGEPSPAGLAGTPGCRTAWRCGCTPRGSPRRRPWLRRTRWPRERRWGCGSWRRRRAPAACTPGSGWSNPMLETQWSPARRLSAAAGGWRETSSWHCEG